MSESSRGSGLAGLWFSVSGYFFLEGLAVLNKFCLLLSCLLLLPFPAWAADDFAQTVRDGFEGAQLSGSNWTTRYAPGNRLSIRAGQAAEGKRALALSVRSGDLDPDCKCQRTEIREAEGIQPVFGREVWYRFSIRLADVGGGFDNNRWMLGGWKQEVDGSPFLAMRFEGGIFYITMESDQTRIMLGSTLIDARTFIEVLKGGQGSKFGFVTDQQLYTGNNSVQLKYGKVKYLPDPRSGWVDLMFRIKGAADESGIIEVYANDRFVVRVTGNVGLDAPQGSRQYLRLGHRRDPSRTSAVLLVDNFRRGSTRESVSE